MRLAGGKIFFVNWNIEIRCEDSEFSVLQPPSGQTCGGESDDGAHAAISWLTGGVVFSLSVPFQLPSVGRGIRGQPGRQRESQGPDPFQTVSRHLPHVIFQADCRYCGYANGNEYLQTLDITDSYIGWRNIGITALWVFAFWGFTVGAMAWRGRKN